MSDSSTQVALPSARIADELTRRISSGELEDGDSVPSTRAITREFGVAMATATRVLSTLRQRGLVHVVPGVGTVVGAALPPTTAANQAAAANQTAGTNLAARTKQVAIAKQVDTTTGPDPMREQALTRDRVVLAGITIADTEGIGALSMRRVATSLDTATMSLYRHVRNKDHLLALMVDRVFLAYPLPRPSADWRPSLEALCRLQWRAYQDHPWIAQYVSMTRPQLIPRAMAHTERSMTVLKSIGLDVGERLHAAVMLANYVRGTAVSLEPEAQAEQDTGLTNDEWMQSQSELMERIIASGQFPAFAEMSTADAVELNLDSLFEFGLDRLMDGLEVLIARRTGPAGNARRGSPKVRGPAQG